MIGKNYIIRGSSNEDIHILYRLMKSLKNGKILAVCSSLEQSLIMSEKSIVTPVNTIPGQIEFASSIYEALLGYDKNLNAEELKKIYTQTQSDIKTVLYGGLPSQKDLEFISKKYNINNIRKPKLGNIFKMIEEYDNFYLSNALDKCSNFKYDILEALKGKNALITTESRKLGAYLMSTNRIKQIKSDHLFYYILI